MPISVGKRQIRIKRYGNFSLVKEVTLETSKVKVRDIILEAVERKNLGQSITEWLEGSSNSPYIIIADKKTVELDESLDEDVKEIELRPVIGGG